MSKPTDRRERRWSSGTAPVASVVVVGSLRPVCVLRTLASRPHLLARVLDGMATCNGCPHALKRPQAKCAASPSYATFNELR